MKRNESEVNVRAKRKHLRNNTGIKNVTNSKLQID